MNAYGFEQFVAGRVSDWMVALLRMLIGQRRQDAAVRTDVKRALRSLFDEFAGQIELAAPYEVQRVPMTLDKLERLRHPSVAIACRDVGEALDAVREALLEIVACARAEQERVETFAASFHSTDDMTLTIVEEPQRVDALAQLIVILCVRVLDRMGEAAFVDARLAEMMQRLRFAFPKF